MVVYLALGDSISIDDYTGVRGCGAASQLARKLRCRPSRPHARRQHNRGRARRPRRGTGGRGRRDPDGRRQRPSQGDSPRAILPRLHRIADRIQPLGARVIIITIYDPSDGDNDVGRCDLSRLAAIELRRRLNALNRGIGGLAAERGFLLADLERLFHGHGVASTEPWFVDVIEPNLAGATATAEHWYELLVSR
jgi:hypothetical protein